MLVEAQTSPRPTTTSLTHGPRLHRSVIESVPTVEVTESPLRRQVTQRRMIRQTTPRRYTMESHQSPPRA
jgi:hypothetical protein